MKIKIISWNVNGLRAVERKGNFSEFLKQYDPDILFLQEIKGNSEQFSSNLIEPENYITFYHSAEKKGYSGTGLWIKKNLIKQSLDYHFFSGMETLNPQWEDNEGRIVGVKIKLDGKEYCLMGIYFPNGGKSEQAFLDKLVFYDYFLDFVSCLQEQGNICIWGGDVNCAHNEIDLARPKENDGVVGFHPKEREWLDRVVKAGWLDIWRTLHPSTTEVYSWWHYFTKSRERNIGWRIDYFFCHKNFMDQIDDIRYLNEQMGSDHCPVVLNIDLK